MLNLSVWLAALLMGVLLGLLGAGGSILTVPILVYLADQPEKLAIAGALFIVGMTALVACIAHSRKNHLHIQSALFVGIPSMISASGGAYLSQFVEGEVQMITLSLIMLLASLVILFPVNLNRASSDITNYANAKMSIAGLLIGLVTGFVGIGGGFLIIPALLVFSKLTMKQAIGTSLLIIAMQSFSGFAKHAFLLKQHAEQLDWMLIMLITVFSIFGTLVGFKVSERMSQHHLKRLFGLLLLPLSGFVLFNNI